MLNEALAAYQAGEHEEAERLYREALAENEAQPDAHHLLAVLQHEHGQLDDALEHAERAVALDPEAASYFLTLGGILHARGDVGGARANVERAVELDPNLPEGHNTLGYLQFVQGELAAAEASLKLALKVQPDHPGIHTNLGMVHLAAGRLERARARFEQALSLRPGDVAARTGLGRTLLAEGAASFAEQCFREALDRRPDSLSLQRYLAEAVLAAGRPDEARELYRRILREHPQDFAAEVGLGDAAARQQRPLAASRHYAQALSRRRGHAPTVRKLGSALLEARQYAAAQRCYERLTGQHPDDPDALTGLGRCQHGLGETERARATLEGVLAAHPDHVEASLALARLHGDADDHDRALEQLCALPAPARERSAVRLARARHGVLAGHPQDALAILAAGPFPEDSALTALELTGRAHDEHGDRAAAAEAFAKLAAEAATPPPELRPVNLPPQAIARWPRTPPDDNRGEPLFLLGLPGSGVSAVAAALNALPRVDVLADRSLEDTARRDFLMAPEPSLDAVDEHRLRMTRRRYWHGVRHVRTKLREGVAAVDWLPPEQTDATAIARFFPRATLLLVYREPADHLLHAETFGWRDRSAPTALDLEDFYGALARAVENSALRLVPLAFDALREGASGGLQGVFQAVGVDLVGFDRALQERLADEDGLHRYWVRGHARHYLAALGLDADQLAPARSALASLTAPGPAHPT